MANQKFEVPSSTYKTELEAAKPADAAKAAGASKQTTALMVPIDQIHILPDFNVRVRNTPGYKEGIAILQGLIDANGYYQHKPLAGYAAKIDGKDLIVIEDGHRRFEAVQALNFERPEEAQIKALPVVVSSQAANLEDMLVNLIVSNSGEPLIPYEKGLVVKRLQGVGMSKEDIAKRLGMTRRYVDDLLVLVEAPAVVRNYMLEGRVSSTQALRELRKDKTKAAERLTAAVKAADGSGKKKATAKDTERAAGGSKPKTQDLNLVVNFGQGDIMSAVLVALAGQLREHVPHNNKATGGDDVIAVAGSIAVTLTLPAPPAAETPAPPPPPPPAPAPETPPAAAPEAAKPRRQRKPAAAAPAPEAAPAAAAKPAAKPKAAAKPKVDEAAAAAKTAAAAVASGLVPAGAGEPDPLAHALGATGSNDADGLADL